MAHLRPNANDFIDEEIGLSIWSIDLLVRADRDNIMNVTCTGNITRDVT